MSAGDYGAAGVGRQDEALSAVARHLGPTLAYLEDARPLTGFGHYASVLQLSDELAVAVCTDGVGTKTMVASALDRYDTIGFDCVAMNVNDLICVGARPLALVDYLGVHTLDPRRTDELLQGLGAAAKEAGVAIPGGEIAQLPEIIGSDGRVAGDERAFDLVGTCIGTLHPDELVLGSDVAPGDALVGVASSGIHSNGLTLARRALGAAGLGLAEVVAELGCSLGDELLRPTEIYARAAHVLSAAGIELHGLCHITGDGFLNLLRLEAPAGYVLDELPEPQAIFGLIQRAGSIAQAEMYRVFNMGIGLIAVVAEERAADVVEVLARSGYRAQRIGYVSDESGVVRIEAAGLVGTTAGGGAFRPA